MTFTKPLPPFDPRTIPVIGVDAHLSGVPAQELTPAALRQRFRHPPVWTPEHSVEKKFSNRAPALAAVLIALVMRDELTLLLTERAGHLSTHSGQVAFPGGKTDDTDRDAVDTALREAHEAGARLYLLFVREQPFMTEQDVKRKWQEDVEASAIFAEAKQKAGDQQPLFAYAVSPSAAETIVDVAATLGASRVILGAPQRSAVVNLLRGNVIREVSNSLPDEIDLLVYA